MTAPPAAPSLTVATFNVRQLPAPDGPHAYPLRRDLLLDTVRSLGADILGTQEPFAAQVDDIAATLPGHRVVGVGRDDGDRAGEWSALFVRRDRLDVNDEGHFWLSATPTVPGSRSWDSSHTRLCSWAHLTDRATGQSLVVYNSHWDHVGETARRHSAGMIASRRASYLAAHRDPAAAAFLPVVVMGDFNCGPDSAALRYLTGAAPTPEVLDGTLYPPSPRLRDAWAEAHPDTRYARTFHGFTGSVAPAPDARIDYLLISDGVLLDDCQIIRTHRAGRYPSDHYPVVARLHLA